MKDKDRMRRYHRLEKTMMIRQLNAMWDYGLDPGTEKRTLQETLVKSE